MRVLEARFHPRRRGERDFIVLGYLIWKAQGTGERPVFEPARASLPEPLLSKLRYLVVVTQPDPFERLQTLPSEFWSFVPIRAEDRLLRNPGDVD